MAVALVQSTKKVATGVNNTTLAYGSNLTAGSLLVVSHAHWQSASVTITTPTDTLTHTYVGTSAEQTSASTQGHMRSFYVENASAGADTVTFDAGGVITGDITCVVAEYSGIVTVSALDKTNTGAGTGTAAASAATTTTSQANELIWGAVTWDGATTTLDETVGGTNGFSIVQENEGGSANMPIGTESKVVSTTGTYTASWTLGASREWYCHVATFKAVVAGGASAVPVMMSQYRRRW